jgi:hypothetical protein
MFGIQMYHYEIKSISNIGAARLLLEILLLLDLENFLKNDSFCAFSQ